MNSSGVKKLLSDNLHYVLLLLVWLINVSWNISDHDDAHTIAYHCFGADVQRSYGAYDSMCDKLLSLLPANYYALYGTMLAVTILCYLLFSYAIIKLVKHYTASLDNSYLTNVGFSLFVMFVAMPDYLYLSFSFKSVIISFAFFLLSHLLLIRSREQQKPGLLIVSILLGGLAASLRWNMCIYFMVMLIDDLYLQSKRSGSVAKAFIQTAIAGFGYLASMLLFIYLSGYSPKGIYETILWGTNYLDSAPAPLSAQVFWASSWMSPVWFLSFFPGLAVLLYRHRKHNAMRVVLLIIGLVLPYCALGFITSLKYLFPFSVLFLLGINYGISYFTSRAYRISLAVLALLPWLVGILFYTNNSNWGPGFELRKDIPASETTHELNAGERLKITPSAFKPAFAAGFANLAHEGLRPLWGHYYTLIGGDLKRFDARLNHEAAEVIDSAFAYNYPVVIDGINTFLYAEICRRDGHTASPWLAEGMPYTERTYTIRDKQLHEFRPNDPKDLFKTKMIEERFAGRSCMLYFTYTSRLNKLLLQYADAGYAIVRFDALHARVTFIKKQQGE